ncbi:indole-3-glycerol phosphate synthase-domain-containing protein [Mrakia frigida]|uniref:bifunctional anthranilate synthase/indole-3-glycerol-phosphate synthase n=1 Tax=Mrakia frigida TaxID=29902 RepID=UPI003FCBF56D
MSFPPSIPASVAEVSVPVPLATASDAVPTHILPPQPKGEIVQTDDRQFTLLIDNYDSFTHNLYQFLEQMGAHVRVVRNDQITLEEIQTYFESGILKNIVISPGPGHPSTDSGISTKVIRWAMGKLPLLGVCMGLQCLVYELGGTIGYAGEIVHGKTSFVHHDGRGLFYGLPQDLKSTRYHSLSAEILSLPTDLQVTSTTKESGVIMGVRHRKFTVEAVQYHPESVMSEGGMELMGNFLKFTGGTWEECKGFGVGEEKVNGVEGVPAIVKDIDDKTHSSSTTTAAPTSSALPTILTQIHAQRLLDVASSESHLSSTPEQLKTNLSLHLSPPLISLVPRILLTSPNPAILAEVKRASPSKGSIAPTTNAASQALLYANAGASVISVLTEPKWFKGSLLDMLAVRIALGELPNRPAVLRKDFILSTYQIDEARLYGADTVLLIVAMLDPTLLEELYAHSVSLGMEPLVEVNNAVELERALEIGAKVIGVNNRNLHDFEVDMGTTSRVNEALARVEGEKPILIALSGITGRKDVLGYLKEGVQGLLVGESLMRAKDPKVFIEELLDLPSSSSSSPTIAPPLVKICGIQSVPDAQMAISAGADLLGLIFVQGSKRTIPIQTAFEIAQLVRATRYSSPPSITASTSSSLSSSPSGWFDHHTSTLASTRKPLLVGVFQNQPLSHILSTVSSVGLDLVQLHGSEPAEWASFIPVPVIRVFHVSPSTGEISPPDVARTGQNKFVLLDAGSKGGTGETFDWGVAKRVVEGGGEGGKRLPIMLAGGLDEKNVAEAVRVVQPWCVDVSSGVERVGGGGKDEGRCREFVRAAKGLN